MDEEDTRNPVNTVNELNALERQENESPNSMQEPSGVSKFNALVFPYFSLIHMIISHLQ